MALAATAVVDLEQPLPVLETGGTGAISVAVRLRGDVLGVVRVPAPYDLVPAAHLADAIAYELGRDLLLAHRMSPRKKANPDRLPSSATVVVCSADRPEQLDRALASIGRLEGSVAEVVVVDNGREEMGSTREVVVAHGARYAREPIAGLDRARNLGIAVASGEVILYTDDDVEVDPQWAVRLIECFDDPSVMAATGLVLPARLDTPSRALSESLASHGRGPRKRVLDGTKVSPVRAGSAGAGASMAFRTDFLRAVGGFPPELDAGTPSQSGGDTFALFQVLQAGYRIAYEPSAVAFHWHRDDDAALHRMLVGYGVGSVSYLTRAVLDPDRPTPPAVAIRGLGLYVSYLARRVARGAARRSAAPPLAYALDEVRGIGRAVRAFPQARREVGLLGPGAEVPASLMPAPLLTQLRSLANVPPAPAGTDLSISVVIPTRGRRGQVSRLLTALEQQSYRGRTETVVVVDGDVDGTAAAIEELSLATAPRVVVLEGDDGRGGGNGAAFARNRGAEVAVNDVLVFLDDDLTPLGPHLLAAHAAVQSTGDVLGIGACPVDLRDERGFFAQMVRGWWSDQTVRMVNGERLHFTDVLSGNMSINRSTFEGIGGFTAMPRREDWDFGCAAELAGLRVQFVDGAGAGHAIDPSVSVALADRRQEGAGDVALARRFPSAAAALPLTRWRQAPLSAELHMHLALRSPDRVDALCAIGLQVLRHYERLGARGQYCRLVDRLALLCYWAGVGEAVGGVDGWSCLVDVIENARPVVQRGVERGTGDVVPGADVEVVQDGEPIGWLQAEFAGGVGHPDFDKWAMAHFLHEAGAPQEPAS